MQNKDKELLKILRLAFFSGFAGGMAEVVFILLYSQFTKTDPIVIGSEITRSFSHFYETGLVAALSGLFIHFALSFITALFFITVIMPLFKLTYSKNRILSTGLIYLAIIWSVNFLILLPKINMVFVELFPYIITLTSKLLFGYSMSVYLTNGTQNNPTIYVRCK